MNTDFELALKKLLDAIATDYRDYMLLGNGSSQELDETQKIMMDNFYNTLTYKEGKKYVKVIKDGSVWGFIMKSDDSKFRAGDILMAASYNTPARNSARGNIFEDYEVKWTGPNYLR